MGMSVGELFISLGFDVDERKLREFDSSVKEVRNNLLKMSAVATGAVYALNAFMEGSALNAVKLRNFTMQTGESAAALQKWQAVIHATNPAVGIDEAFNKYKAFNEYIRATRFEGGGVALSALGVTVEPQDKIDQILEKVRVKLPEARKHWSPSQISKFLDDMGIGAGAEPALGLSREEFESQAASSVQTEDSINRQKEYAATIAQIDNELKKLSADIVAQWGPGLSDGIKDFDASLRAFVEGWKEFSPMLKDAIVGFGALLAGMLALSSPLLATGAAFAAIAAAIWDIGRAMRGLPSFSGDGWNGFKMLTGQAWGAVSSPGLLLGDQARGVGKSMTSGYAVTSYFEKMGWSHANAAGIASGLQMESGLDPMKPQANGGPGFGLAQWGPERQADFKAWSGHDIHQSNFYEQLAFLNYEMTKGKYKKSGSLLRQQSDPSGSYDFFRKHIERPADIYLHRDAEAGRALANRNAASVTQNVNINIHGTDPQETAIQVKKQLTQHFNLAGAALNLGASY